MGYDEISSAISWLMSVRFTFYTYDIAIGSIVVYMLGLTFIVLFFKMFIGFVGQSDKIKSFFHGGFNE